MNNSRFTGKKISAATVAALARTADEDNFATREAIFEKNRPEIQYQFRFVDLSFKSFIFKRSGTPPRM